MVKERKQEITDNLISVHSQLIEENNNPYEPIAMFDVISYYTNNYDNEELIGGSWVRENIPELADIPS